MKGIREIRRRIKAVKSTEKITRAMQLVAVAKMKKAQDAARGARPYSLLLAEILESLVDHAENLVHPLLEEREVKKRGVLVVSTDRGLCGPLNSNLFRLVTEMPREETAFIAVGKKAAQFLARTQRDMIAQFTVSDKCTFKEVRGLVEFLVNSYLEGRIDTLEVVFPRFINTLKQEPALERLLPLSGIREELEALKERLGVKGDDGVKDDREFVYEPGAQVLLEELPAMYVKQELYQMILEARASEHSARMVAMKSATDNAKELVGKLSLEYNKARQAAITQEILELAVAGGVEKER